MERTIQEIYTIIWEKRENAEKHYLRESKTSRTPIDKRMLSLLEGEIEAYTDVLILIETSEVLK